MHDRHKHFFAVRKMDLSVLLGIVFIVSVYIGDVFCGLIFLVDTLLQVLAII